MNDSGKFISGLPMHMCCVYLFSRDLITAAGTISRSYLTRREIRDIFDASNLIYGMKTTSSTAITPAVPPSMSYVSCVVFLRRCKFSPSHHPDLLRARHLRPPPMQSRVRARGSPQNLSISLERVSCQFTRISRGGSTFNLCRPCDVEK